MKHWKWVKRHRMTIDRVTTALVTLSMVMSLMPSQGIAWAQEQVNPQPVESTEEVLLQDELQDATQADQAAEAIAQEAATAESPEVQDETPTPSTPTDTHTTDYETPVAEQPSATDSYQSPVDTQTYQQVSTPDPVTYQDVVEYGNLKITLELRLAQTGYEAKGFNVTIQNARGEYLTNKGAWTKIEWPKDITRREKDAMMPKDVKFAVSQANMLNVWNLPVGTYTVREVRDDAFAIVGYTLDSAASTTKVKRIDVRASQDSEVKLVNVYQQTPAAAEEPVVRASSADATPTADATPAEPAPTESDSAQVAQPVEETPAETEVTPAPADPTFVEVDVTPTDEEATPEEEAAAPEDETPTSEDETTTPEEEQATEDAATDETAEPTEADESADDEAKEEEEPAKDVIREYTYEDAKVKVVATLEQADAIPDAAELKVTPVTETTRGYNYDAYMSALNKDAGEDEAYTADNTLLYDIAFLAKDDAGNLVELQPAAGSVKVKVTFKDKQLSEGINATQDEVRVVHLPLTEAAMADADTTAQATNITEGDVLVEDVDATVKVRRETATFETDSLSVWAFTGDPSNQITIPETETATFKESDNYLIRGTFEELANFGLVGFTSIEQKDHLHSNFATKTYILSNNGEFGRRQANQLPETFYIESAVQGNLSSGMIDAYCPGTQVVLGRDLAASGKISATPTQRTYSAEFGGKTWSVNAGEDAAKKVGNEYQSTLFRVEREGTKYVDLDALQEKAIGISQKFSERTASGYELRPDDNPSNTLIFERGSDSNYIATASFTADEFCIRNKVFHIDETNVDGVPHVLIINVDVAGRSEISLPSVMMKDGSTSQTYTGEVQTWTTGNTIINIYDSSQPDKMYRGKITTSDGQISGSILAPCATVDLGGSVNGQVFADKIIETVEFHRDSITFTNEIPSIGGLRVAKTLDGSSSVSQRFTFRLEGLNGAPMPSGANGNILEKQNEADGLVTFGFLNFSEEEFNNGIRAYRYKVSEVVPSSANVDFGDGKKLDANNNMVYDANSYVVEVHTRRSSNGGIGIAGYTVYAADGTTVVAEMDYDSGKAGVVTFDNQTVTSGEVKGSIKAKKTFDGDEWPADGFKIELAKVARDNGTGRTTDGLNWAMPPFDYQIIQGYSLVQTVTKNNPTAVFDNLTFQNLGTYYYTLKEVVPSGATVSADGKTAEKDGIIYDNVTHDVTVTVSQAGSGKVATVTYDGNKKSLTIANKAVVQTGNLKITKVVDGATLTAAEKANITFSVTSDVDGFTTQTKAYSAFEDNSWTLEDLKPGTYTVTETAGDKAGYTRSTTYSVEGGVAEVTAGETAEVTVTNTYTATTVDVAGAKIWADNNNEADKRADITVKLQKKVGEGDWTDVEGKTKEITADATGDDLKYSFTGLTEYENGTKVAYQVVETNVPQGYTVSGGTAAESYNLTNTIKGKRESELPVSLVVEKQGAAGAKLPGATFTLTPAGETTGEAETYTTGDAGTVSITFTKPGTWTLQETAAPEGYVLNNTTYNIEVTREGTAEITYKDEGEGFWNWAYQLIFGPNKPTLTDGKLVVEDTQTSVSISKVATGAGTELPGAKLQVLDAEGEKVEEWVSGDTPHEIKGLKTGVTYTLHEETAPDGYTIAADTTFTIEADGTVKSGETVVADGHILVNDAKTKVTISKTDMTGETELAGAELEIRDKDGAVVTLNGAELKHTSVVGQPWVVEGLKAGVEYTLVETTAPNGYTIAAATTFTIDSDGTVKVGETAVTGGKILVKDAPTEVTVSKKAVGGEDELPGATLQVLDDKGNVVKVGNETLEWESTSEAKVIKGLKVGETYTLKETIAPDGYTVASTIEFSIDETGKVTAGGKVVENGVVLVEDALTEVTVSKKAVGGEDELPGATLQVLDKDGKVVKVGNETLEWESGTEAKVIKGLKTGETYTLKETVAPDGYTVASTIEFSIDETGKVTAGGKVVENGVVLVEDALTEVTVSKKAVGGEDELPGATLQVLDKDGKVVKVGNETLEWESGTKAKTITGLKTGVEYTLKETVAPDGYTVTSEIKFMIDETGKVTAGGKVVEGGVVLVEDAPTSVTISKTDMTGDKELAGAKLEIMVPGKDGKLEVVILDGKALSHISEADKPWTVTGLKTGIEYTLVETTAPNGYTIAASTKFTIAEDGTVTHNGTEVENGQILVKDAPTEVTVSKKAVGGESELAGATLQVLDKDGNVAKDLAGNDLTWTSGTEAKVITGLKVGETYTLKETVAPDGYAIASEITFSIDKTGKVTAGDKVVEGGVILIEDAKTKVTISKRAVTGEDELAGATLQVLDDKGAIVKLGEETLEWTSGTTPKTIEGLTPGTYTLREKTAPDGYTITTDTTFTIATDGTVTTTGSHVTDAQGNVIVVVNDAPTSVSISKVDITSQKEIAGAHIQILEGTTLAKDLAGNDVEWDSTTTPHVVTGLKTGVVYTLHETVAPKGYTLASDTTFKIGTDGKVDVMSSSSKDDEGKTVLLVEDAQTLVKISKVDVVGGAELPGAEIKVTDDEGTEVDSWTSVVDDKETAEVNEAIHEIRGLEVGKTYTLTETVAPDGYTIATATTFTIEADGTVKVKGTEVEGGHILIDDARTKITVSKKAVGGENELPGATLQVLDAEGNLAEDLAGNDLEWESGTKAKVIEGLKTNTEYTLKETVAPDGYAIASEIKFTIDENGKVTAGGKEVVGGALLVEDALTKVTISKRDMTGGDEELPGATLQVRDSEGNVVKLGEETLEWTSGDKPKVIEGLAAGTYTLHEEAAPTGYTVATDTTFTIEADGTVTVKGSKVAGGVVVINDAPTTVKVSKVDIADGAELPGATIQVLDKDGKVVKIGEETLEWTSVADDESTEDINEAIHEIAGLKAGETYTLRETVAPEGYAIATDITFTIDETGKVSASGKVTEDGVILIEDAKTSIKVSKVAAGAGTELPGADIKIKDATGKVVAEWTSVADDKTTEKINEGIHEVEGLTGGQLYTLVETVAPAGYAIATETTFFLNTDGTIDASKTTTKVSESGVLLIEDALTKVTISKRDMTGGDEELPGATLQVLDKDGKVVKDLAGNDLTWTSGDKPKVIEGLTAGIYTLHEEAAPDGYTVATDTTFTIEADGTVTVGGSEVAGGVVVVNDAPTSVKVSKVAVGGGAEIAGAHIQVLDKDGKVVEVNNQLVEWDSEAGKTHEIVGLKTGEIYTLRETVAPEGYATATDITFTLNADGSVTTTAKTNSTGAILIEDDILKIRVSKTETGAGKELPGATLQVLDKDGKVVEVDGEKIEWVSGETPHEIVGLKPGVEYTLRETTAPDGYTVTTDTTFTINADGSVTSSGSTTKDANGVAVLLVEDEPTKISISKKAVGGEDELPGATLQILDKDGKVVTVGDETLEWKSGTEAKTITGLKTGVEYTLKETVAPAGYTIASEIKFTIDETGKVTAGGKEVEGGALLVEDALTSVTISKKAVSGENELEGATLQVLAAGEDGKLEVVTINNEKVEWTSGTEPKTIEGLTAGVTYTLRETVAPEGYAVATDITFTIDETGKVTTTGKTTTDKDGNTILLVEDDIFRVKISKVDIAGGDELPGATIQILDDKGAEIESWTSEADKEETTEVNEGIHEITGLKPGVTYTLRETVAPDGYAVATDTTFTLDEHGKVTTTGSVTEDGVILINDAKTKVSISKVDVDGGAEIAGATLQVLGEDGKVVKIDNKDVEWTSTTEPHVIEGLKTGVTYTLHEDLAPAGYTVATDTTFTIEADGTVKVISASSKDVDGKTVLLVGDAKTLIKVSKVEAGAGKEIAGAHIQIINPEGKVVAEWDSLADDKATTNVNEGIHEIEGLETGVEYTLRETVAPDGYTTTSDTKFTIDKDGKVSGSATVNEDGVILVEDTKTKVLVSKTETGAGEELPGATLQVIDSKGEVVEEWTSGDEPHLIEGLKAGEEYTLRETTAPDGYTITSDTKFTIDETGKVTGSGTVTTGEGGVPMVVIEDAPTSVTFSKKAVGGEDELPGATLQVLDDKGNVVKVGNETLEWTSGTEAKTITGLKTGVTYTLKETVAPDGYTIASTIEFTIEADGTVKAGDKVVDGGVVLIEDAPTKVLVSKTETGAGEELHGATLQVIDSKGKVVEEWTSGEEPHLIEGLKAGEEYTLRETTAPDGYTITSDTKFTIDEDGKVTGSGTVTTGEGGVPMVVVEDEPTKVTISKTDMTGEEELDGAILQILGEDGKVVKQGETELTYTSKAGEPWVVTGLKTGVTYTLRETTAPDGYSITADTTFSIDETGKVTYSGTIAKDKSGNEILLVKDAPLGGPTKVIISKTDITGEEELAGATLEIRDASGKVVEIDGTKLTWTSTGSERWFVEGLETGVEYTLVETVAPDGYTIAAATKFTIDEDGKVTDNGTEVEGGVILVEDAPTKIKVSKTETGAGEELPGATIQILAKNDKGELEVVEVNGEKVEWVSGDEPHEIEGLKTGVEYTLRETTAPAGYTIATDTTFTIDETGKVTGGGSVSTGEDGVPVLLIEDAPIKVKVSKADITNGDEELAGAQMKITFRDDAGQERTLEEWTSGEAPHEVAGLKVGVKYTLVETVAPEGYTVATATKFTVDKDGKVTSDGSTSTDKDGYTVLLVNDSKTSVKISKTETGAGEELPGATLQVLAKNDKGELEVVKIDGKPVEWVSGDAPHEVAGLKTGVEYTLRETTAPDGYTITTDTTFTIAPDGTVKGNDSTTTDEDGNTILVVEDKPTKVTVSKTDMTGDEELDGAVLQIMAKNDKGELEVVTLNGEKLEHTSKAGEPWVVEGLTTGVEYTIRETTAPDGYTIATDTTFTIDEKGEVTYSGSTSTNDKGETVLLVNDAPTKVLVSKTETGAGKELPGATLQVLDKDGEVVEEWVSGDEPHLIEGLKAGEEYTLRETTAPDGYTITSDTKFTIDEDGKVTGSGTVTTGEGGVPMVVVEDAPTKVTVSKVATGAGEELPGATIQILDAQGKVVEEWISGDEPHEVTKLKTGVTYTLRETVAPEGYDIATDTTFSIDETGKVTTTGTMTEDGVILIEDTLKGEGPTKVIISKTDITGEQELSGAVLQIMAKNDKGELEVVTLDGKELVWTSNGSERWFVEGLEKGVEYTLRETTAPDGYTIAADTTFTIGEDGTVTSTGTVTDAGVILVEDAPTKVALSKTDMTGDVELDGAVLQILGEDGEVVELNGEKLEHTSKAGEPWVVEGLETGVEYTIRETTAPDGYTIATDTTFTINEDGTVDYGGGTSTMEDGTPILLVEDAPTKVTISKVATGAGEELPGATLQVLAENEDGELEVVEVNGEKLEWVSGDEPKVIEGLKTGVEYTLRETTAPDGYTITTDTTFTIAEDGAVTGTGSSTTDEDGNTVLLVEDEPTKIKVSKVETGAGEELPGATIQILAENEEGELEVVKIDGKPVEWVSVDAPHEVVGLKTGVEYTLRETVAPAGYAVTTDTTFIIDETGKVEATGTTTTDEDGTTVLLIEDDRISVRVSKVETGAGEEVPGATLQVIDADGTVVDEWISGDKPHDIVGLMPGAEYTLRETVAPEGYTVATDTTFSIDEDGKVTTTGSQTTDEDGNTVLLVEDDRTSVKVSKTDVTGEEELAGAKIQILDDKGKVVEEWTSAVDDEATADVNEAIHEIRGLKTGVTYTLRETVAPEGYDIATDTTFTIDETGKVTTTGTMTEGGVILIEDAPLGGLNKVIISKTDIGGEKELAGARLEIRDKDGQIVKVDGKELAWTSVAGARWFVTGLKAGVEYQLVETIAPDGYLLTSAITFSIDEDGTVTAGGKVVEGGRILVEDEPTKVTVSKVDTGAGEELPGAELQVLAKNEDGELEVVEIDGKPVEWISGDKPHVIEGLSVGVEYTLRETTAPEGYAVTSDTTFTIDETGKVTGTGTVTTDKDGNTILVVEDAPTKVTISKTDMTGKTELDGAELQILAENADGELEVVELNDEELTHTSKAGEPWVVEGLPTGVEYTLRETTAPDGYTISEDTTFTINEDGTVTYSGSTATNDKGETVLLVNDAPTKVTISKTDMTGEEELSGAKLEIRDAAGKVVTLNGAELKHTSKAGEPWVVEGLKAGVEYTLVETTAPDGYTVAAETTFTIAEDGTVDYSGTTTTNDKGETVLLVEDAPTKVTVSKTAVGAGDELPGATIQILGEDGRVVELNGQKVEWVSGDEPHEVTGLKTGVTYTLKETVAPDGYAIATETTFSIAADGTITTTGSVTEDGILLINDALTSVSISKVDVDGGAEIAGAKLQVLGEDGKVATTVTGKKAEWTSTTKPHVIEGLKTGVTYTLHEDLAPAGYTVATDTTFTIEANGTVKVISASSKDVDGKTVLLVNDAKTVVRVSKTDVTGEEELPGAHIQILKADGSVADEWTSVADDTATDDVNEAIHVIEGLETGVVYKLKETVAPDGYTIATVTTFSIDATGKVTTTGTMNEDGVILVKDELTKLTVSKTAIAGSGEIPGAKLQIMDADAKNVVKLADGSEAKWTSTDKPYEISGLKAGETYVLRETVAPNGYSIATDITFTLDETGAVSIKGTKVDGNYILVEDALTEVRVSKTAVAGSEELPGATLKVIKKDASGIEDVIKTWTSGTEPELIRGLVANTEYILRETVAPDGYAVTTDITFTVDEHNKVTTSGKKTTDEAGNDVLLVEDALTKLTVSKTDITGEEEVAGATIQILDDKDKVVEEWTSGDEPHEVTGLKTGVTYTLRETVAPDGYTIATDTTFTINARGEVVVEGQKVEDNHLLVKDDLTKVTISKTDMTGEEELTGAKLQIQDADGKVVKIGETELTHTSKAGEPWVVEGLTAGVEYTLVETTAPAGYTVAAATKFTIEADGSVTTKGTTTTDEDGNEVLLVKDEITSVKVSKTDIADGKELAGATIQILDADGKVVEIDGKKVEWTSGDAPHEVTGLTTGVTYTLRETVAPEGYGIAADTTFSIAADGTVVSEATITDDGVILVEDALLVGKAAVSLTKEMKANVPYAAEESFTFTLATENGRELGELSLKAGEAGSFDEIGITEAGTTYYTITETAGKTPHVTYDTEPKWAKVVATANPQTGEYDVKVTYGATKDTCTEEKLTIENIYAVPALEKYINKDVHQDLPAFDTPFTYDILAFVTNDADTVVITDPLVKGIRFLNGEDTPVKVQDIGEANDHTAHGTVEQAAGTDLEATCTIDDDANGGRSLTVTINNAKSQGIRGHWVRVTYQVALDNEVVGVEDEYIANDEEVTDNNTVISEAYPDYHDGVKTGASYVVTAENGQTYELDANDITVTPPIAPIAVAKKWVDANGKTIDWPKGAKVTLELLGNGKSLDKLPAEVMGEGRALPKAEVVLSEDSPTGAFIDVPIYEKVTYTVAETKVTGVSAGFTAVCTGDPVEGFEMTNTFNKETPEDDKPSDDGKKPSKDDKTSSSTTNKSSSTNSSNNSLAKTDDPFAGSERLIALLGGAGAALVLCGAFARRRRREDA